MSDRMPVEDVIGTAVSAEPWTCPNCGHENKATWIQCPDCESTPDGRLPADREPPRPRFGPNPVNVVLGVLIVAALIVVAMVTIEPLWDWVTQTWNDLLTWLDGRL